MRIPVTTWEQLCSLPEGARLREVTKFREVMYRKGLVTRDKGRMEIHYEKKSQGSHFWLTDQHFKEAINHGNVLYHIVEDHFDDDLFSI